MNDLILFSGCTLAGAIVGGGIGWAVCSIIAGAKIFAMRQDAETSKENANYYWGLWRMSDRKLRKTINAIPPKRPRENGTVTKVRRILEGGE